MWRNVFTFLHNGRQEYLQKIGKQTCRRLYEFGSFRIANDMVDGIIRNATNLRTVTLAGSATADASCEGAQHTDGYGNWRNVVVQAILRITLKTFEVAN